jgi:tetratricopeptide (TPR) repeat protein
MLLPASLAASIAAYAGAPVAIAAGQPSYAHKMEMAQMLFFNGDINGAIRAFEYAATLNPKAFEPHLNLLNLYLQKGGDDALEKACHECDEVLQRKPNQKDTHMIYGNLLRTQAGTIADQAQATAKLDAAQKELEIAIEQGSPEAICENTIGLILLQKGDRDAALKHIDIAIKKQPIFPDAHLVRAVLLFKNVSTVKASGLDTTVYVKDLNAPELQAAMGEVMKELTLAIDQKGKNAEARNTRGDILYAQGKYDAALADYKKATDDDLRYAQAWAGMGNCYLQQKKWDEASDAYDKARTLRPDDKNLVYGLAVMLEKAGESQRAIAEFQKALVTETDPQWRNQIQGHLQQLTGNPFGSPTFGSIGGIGSGLETPGAVGQNMFTSGALSQPFKDLIKIKEPEGKGAKQAKDAESKAIKKESDSANQTKEPDAKSAQQTKDPETKSAPTNQ